MLQVTDIELRFLSHIDEDMGLSGFVVDFGILGGRNPVGVGKYVWIRRHATKSAVVERPGEQELTIDGWSGGAGRTRWSLPAQADASERRMAEG